MTAVAQTQKAGLRLPQSAERIDDLIDLHAVLRITTLPKRTIYRLIEDGRFPKQIELTAKNVRWHETEILAWMQARCARA